MEARPGALASCRPCTSVACPWPVASSTPGRHAGHVRGTLWVRPLHEDRRVCGRPADEQTRTGCLRSTPAASSALIAPTPGLSKMPPTPWTPCARPATALAPSTTTTSPAPATSSSSAPTSSSPHGRISTPTSFSPRPALKRQNRKIRATARKWMLPWMEPSKLGDAEPPKGSIGSTSPSPCPARAKGAHHDHHALRRRPARRRRLRPRRLHCHRGFVEPACFLGLRRTPCRRMVPPARRSMKYQFSDPLLSIVACACGAFLLR